MTDHKYPGTPVEYRECGGRFDARSGHCDSCAAIDPSRAGLRHAYPGPRSVGQPPFTLHYAQHGCYYTMESEFVSPLKAEARDMADKGWAHPERITDVLGRVLRWDAFGINEPGEVWEDAPADRMEEDT